MAILVVKAKCRRTGLPSFLVNILLSLFNSSSLCSTERTVILACPYVTFCIAEQGEPFVRQAAGYGDDLSSIFIQGVSGEEELLSYGKRFNDL